jgi:hypothetical protein
VRQRIALAHFLHKGKHYMHTSSDSYIHSLQHTIYQFLTTLYPDPPAESVLSCTYRQEKNIQSRWFHADDLVTASTHLAEKSLTTDAYIGMGLRSLPPDASPHWRGKNDDVIALPGLWLECDHNAGIHSNSAQYPSVQQLLDFIANLPLPPSLIIDSGGGYHLHWLFKELWLLTDADVREEAAQLLRNFQAVIRNWAQADGWTIDVTHDLARMLRPPGTSNFKYQTPRPVVLISDSGQRFNPSDIAEEPWLVEYCRNAPSTPSSTWSTGAFTPTALEPLVDQCAWLRHCREDAECLPEPEWYAMLGIIGRCQDGETLAHQWSAPYPRYSPQQTDAKLAHALKHGPATCLSIEREKNGKAFCESCAIRGVVTSPIMLAREGSPKVFSSSNSTKKEGEAPKSPSGALPHVPRIQVTDMADMMPRTYPEQRWLIPGLIPEGLTFFVGSPKSSKTYLAYSLALSLALSTSEQAQWLGHYDIQLPGPVVYLTLEDDEADSRLRIQELMPWLDTIERNRLLFVHGFDLPRFNEGLVDALRNDIILPYKPALVVIDPISYLYAPVKKGGDQFQEVREMLLPLRWLGKEHHCSLLAIDHRRKKSADDVDIFETTYGSNAKIAIADSLLMVVRDDKEVTIHARVRKGMDQTLTLGFDFSSDGMATWTWRGATNGIVSEGSYGDLRTRILQLLRTLRTPLTVETILLELEIPTSAQTRDSVKKILYRAEKAGEVEKTTRGSFIYVHSS